MRTTDTIKNIGKTTLFALIALFVSFSYLTAQDSLLNLTAYSNDCQPDKTVVVNHAKNEMVQLVATFSSEQPTEIEPWMSSTSYWVDLANEPEKKIESWMKDTNYWNSQAIDNETVLEIENWMSDKEFWQPSQKDLEIESWMADTEYWSLTNETEAQLENWMAETSYWKK